jgi:hypothetical protein
MHPDLEGGHESGGKMRENDENRGHIVAKTSRGNIRKTFQIISRDFKLLEGKWNIDDFILYSL